jgi:zinc D-Ala-D-Ala dipeptidase
MESGFLFLDEALPGIRWDAKYATWDNFTGRPVAGYDVNRVAVSRELADGLRRMRDRAADHGFGLLVWDAFRPQRAVDDLVRWSAAPEDGRTKAVFYPNIARADMLADGYVAARSGHTRGSAVDLTLYRLDSGELVAMGGGHDLMDARSHHDAAGIPTQAARNRTLLRSLMERSGFRAIPQEWWHYALRDEPYPDRYFDFPVA